MVALSKALANGWREAYRDLQTFWGAKRPGLRGQGFDHASGYLQKGIACSDAFDALLPKSPLATRGVTLSLRYQAHGISQVV